MCQIKSPAFLLVMFSMSWVQHLVGDSGWKAYSFLFSLHPLSGSPENLMLHTKTDHPRSSGRLIAPIMSMKEPCWIKQPRHNVKSVSLPIDDWEPMKVTNSWGNFCCIKSCSKKAKSNIIWQCWISGFYRPFYQAEHTWVLGSIFLAVSGRIAGNGNKIREIWWGPGLYWPGLY